MDNSLVAPPTPSDQNTSAELFRKMMLGVSVMCGFTHLAFLVLFHVNGIRDMALVNVGSILCYVLTFVLALRHQVTLAWMLITTEVVGHAVLAVYYIGWDSGFHIYIMCVPPVMVVSTLPVWRGKVPVVTGLMALYLWLDYARRDATPLFELDRPVLNGVHYFTVVTALTILVLLAGMYYRFVLQSEQQLREMATTDPLTRLRNRRSVLDTSVAEAAKQRRDGRPLSFILCDVDHFKMVNDTHGHQAGDDVLKAVAKILRSGVREVDHAARWGGEEFLLLLPETASPGAELVANRLREAISELQVPGKDGPLKVTMTFGISNLHLNEPIEQAIARADKALYQGKRGGRNRVELAPEDVLLRA
ncbi:GGDEF domain-containing protein [Aquabacterium sp.]|uniref:GGDEF domain-containing protein n=1 Tax=Aquabacterium sp. TaxID=1872578 RepID=UPI002486D77C|nr:GGDEF domain-containing protein [Aquabacterium sp.]MDI1258218.1 GGDEF domain-containing protein [Aquabacterium sp.]